MRGLRKEDSGWTRAQLGGKGTKECPWLGLGGHAYIVQYEDEKAPDIGSKMLQLEVASEESYNGPSNRNLNEKVPPEEPLLDGLFQLFEGRISFMATTCWGSRVTITAGVTPPSI